MSEIENMQVLVQLDVGNKRPLSGQNLDYLLRREPAKCFPTGVRLIPISKLNRYSDNAEPGGYLSRTIRDSIIRYARSASDIRSSPGLSSVKARLARFTRFFGCELCTMKLYFRRRRLETESLDTYTNRSCLSVFPGATGQSSRSRSAAFPQQMKWFSESYNRQ